MIARRIFLVNACENLRIGQFPQRIGGNPFRARMRLLAQRFRQADRFVIQGHVPLADLPQSPVDRLFDKIAPISGGLRDERKESDKRLIIGMPIVNG